MEIRFRDIDEYVLTERSANFDAPGFRPVNGRVAQTIVGRQPGDSVVVRSARDLLDARDSETGSDSARVLERLVREVGPMGRLVLLQRRRVAVEPAIEWPERVARTPRTRAPRAPSRRPS